MYKCNFCIGDLGINGIADLKHNKISSHGSPFLPAGPSGPWAKMMTLGRKFFYAYGLQFHLRPRHLCRNYPFSPHSAMLFHSFDRTALSITQSWKNFSVLWVTLLPLLQRIFQSCCSFVNPPAGSRVTTRGVPDVVTTCAQAGCQA